MKKPKKHPKRTKLEETYKNELNPTWQKNKALKALEKAKALEAAQRSSGKKYVKINAKTTVLK